MLNFLTALIDAHFHALQHTLNFIYTTASQGIILYAFIQFFLQAFSNSDWGSCILILNEL